MRLDLFVELKYESSTKIVFVGIRYSMRDLLYDLNKCQTPCKRQTVRPSVRPSLGWRLTLTMP